MNTFIEKNVCAMKVVCFCLGAEKLDWKQIGGLRTT
jgi:hypothetical protein